jgi:hypothetical protein
MMTCGGTTTRTISPLSRRDGALAHIAAMSLWARAGTSAQELATVDVAGNVATLTSAIPSPLRSPSGGTVRARMTTSYRRWRDQYGEQGWRAKLREITLTEYHPVVTWVMRPLGRTD